ncbi:MAG: hypothetical protein QXH67_00520 [Candidatus Bathyarchaeia archaeon]
MYWVEKTRFPPVWEKETYNHEPERFVPPHLFLLNRAFCTGLLFFNRNEIKKIPIAFSYISSYLNKYGEKICRIERLTYLNSSRENKIEILEEILKIATLIYGKIDIFEAEVFIDVNSSIFFPSSLFILGSCNKKEVLNLYLELEFELTRIKYCYEIDINSININKVPNARIHSISSEEWPKYWTLWGMSDECPDTSYLLKKEFKIRFGDLVPPLSEPSYVIMYKDFGSFFDHIMDTPTSQGFVQWAPNIYKLLLHNNKMNLEKIDLSYLDEAKIFKFNLMSRDYSKLNNSYGNIIDLTLSFLKSKRIKKCQIGNFEESHPAIIYLKKKYPTKCSYTIGTLQKRIKI